MGFSASSSSNPQTTTNTQTTQSVAGASAEKSPTVFAGGGVNITDAGQTENALLGMRDISLAALSNSLGLLGDFNARQAQAQVDAARSGTDLLSSVLGNNQTLAQNVQSGGATVGMALTTKIVWGVLALAGAVIAVVLFRKSK